MLRPMQVLLVPLGNLRDKAEKKNEIICSPILKVKGEAWVGSETNTPWQLLPHEADERVYC